MKYFFIFSTYLLLLIACSNDSEEINPNEGENNPDTTKVPSAEEIAPVTVTPSELRITYNKDIAPLIEQRCFMCHNNPTDNGAPTDAVFTDFERVRSFAAAINFRVGNGTMPNTQGGGPLPQVERDLIDAWVKGDLLEE